MDDDVRRGPANGGPPTDTTRGLFVSGAAPAGSGRRVVALTTGRGLDSRAPASGNAAR